MSVTVNQAGPLGPGKDTAEPPGSRYHLRGALCSFTVTKPVTLFQGVDRSWERGRLEEKGHVNFSNGGDCAYNTITGFSPWQRVQS